MLSLNSKRHLRLRNTYRAIKHAIKKKLIGVVSVIGYGLLQSDKKIHSLVSVWLFKVHLIAVKPIELVETGMSSSIPQHVSVPHIAL